MDSTVLQENFQQALGLILRAISTKNELPILANVLLEAREGKLFLSGTNLEMGMQTAIGGKVEKEGAITVPAKFLFEFTSTLTAGKIQFSLKDSNLVVKGARSQAQFSTIPASEFPPFPQKGEKTSTISGEDMASIAAHVAFAASTDEGRPVLTGLQIKQTEEGLTVAATDGFRLSIQKISQKTPSFPDTIIPARTISEIAKIISSKESSDVTVNPSKNEGQLIFTTSDATIFTRLLEGEFPNYQRIVPTSSTSRAVCERSALVQAVKASAIFARESANIVRLKLSKNKLIISANSPQMGEEVGEVEAEITGEENEIAFNYRFLIDFLNSVNEEEVVFEMTSPLSPGLLRGKEDSAYIHIIMPVRVQGA